MGTIRAILLQRKREKMAADSGAQDRATNPVSDHFAPVLCQATTQVLDRTRPGTNPMLRPRQDAKYL